ncbi:chloride channel protein [Flavobacterium rakeshii]|uniref:Chloride channel protein n=1 Tax=Flavobacterium rakeshii TaxID=1038845 RepID=A0A6N8HG72_9FLAO|nr:chloride channel protein [Flavobacterium rakeshii]MUV04703.1 chloride channel protein [Flavobacterium rakeshii]
MKNIKRYYKGAVWLKLIVTSLLVGFLSCTLSISLKHITEHFEDNLLERIVPNKLYLLIFPLIGFTVIYFLRHYLFKGKENKGIKEVFDSVESGKNLPSYKIPSHFVNGLITVGFGGSTGIEVSTVVSTAAIGNIAYKKERFLKKYKTELICAGVAAGITALFSSPLAGLLFAYEVISRRLSKSFIIATVLSVSVAYGLLLVLDEPPLFHVTINFWKWTAIPYFIVLGIIAGLNSVYLTKCVLLIKKQFFKLQKQSHRIILGAFMLSLILLFLPQLYGDGYHAIKENLETANTLSLTLPITAVIIAIIIIKPIITSVTLGAGGDGGVFAPSIFIGAFLGLLVALLVNTFFNAAVIPLNFMIVGMAAMLSASIHAPLTSLFLVCGVIGDYTLFVPLLIVCYIAKITSKRICSYNVYTYKEKLIHAG